MPKSKSCSRSSMWLSKRDDKDEELQAAQTTLVHAREDAVTDLEAAKEARQELISQHEETVRILEEQVDKYRSLQEVQYELAQLQSLGMLHSKFDDERLTLVEFGTWRGSCRKRVP